MLCESFQSVFEEKRLSQFLDVFNALDNKDILDDVPECESEIRIINLLCRGNVQQGKQSIEKWNAVKKFVSQLLDHGQELARRVKRFERGGYTN